MHDDYVAKAIPPWRRTARRSSPSPRRPTSSREVDRQSALRPARVRDARGVPRLVRLAGVPGDPAAAARVRARHVRRHRRLKRAARARPRDRRGARPRGRDRRPTSGCSAARRRGAAGTRRSAPRTRSSGSRTPTSSCSRPRAPVRSPTQLEAKLARDGEGLAGLAFGTDDAAQCTAELRARGIAAGDPVAGAGHDEHTGAKREWRNVMIPSRRDARRLDVRDRAPLAARGAAARRRSRCRATRRSRRSTTRSCRRPIPRRRCASTATQLGLRLALDRSFDARGVRLQFFRVGGVTVEVASRLARGRRARARPAVGARVARARRRPRARRLVEAGFAGRAPFATATSPARACARSKRDTCGVPTLMIAPG